MSKFDVFYKDIAPIYLSLLGDLEAIRKEMGGDIRRTIAVIFLAQLKEAARYLLKAIPGRLGRETIDKLQLHTLMRTWG